MGFAFNPFTGNFDQKGSGGGGSSYIDGEVQNFSALPETAGTPPVDSAYLVREAEGAWLLSRKPAGIYIRTGNSGVRADDWTYAGEFPDVFSDDKFVLYDETDSSKNLVFQLSGISTGTTRTLTVPDASGTIALTSQAADMEITDNTKGVILKSANNTRYRLTVSNSGLPVFTALLIMLLVSLAPAQNVGMATDTNGTILTDRTNAVTFTNPVAWNNSTNAATTITNLFSSNSLPSGAAAAGSLLTAAGDGSSAFVESRTQFSRIMSATSRSNWTNNDWSFAVNDDTNASLSLAANTVYRVTWNLNITVATNTLSWGYTLAATATFITNLQRNGTYQHRDGLRTVGWETSAGQSTAVRGDGGGQILESRTNMDRIVGGSMVIQTGTNAATLYFRWWPGQNTNQPVSLGTNSWLHAEKLN